MSKRNPSFRMPAIVEVDWNDSFTAHGWESLNDRQKMDRKAANCRTVGYLVAETPLDVRIAESIAENNMLGCTSVIPKHAISAMRTLRSKK